METQIIEEFKSFTDVFFPVGMESINSFLQNWNSIEFKRKEIITREGETENYLYYVIKGVQRAYRVNGDKEYVIAFTYPPSFSGIPNSFLSQTPSKYYLETITESKFLRISYEKLNSCLESDWKLERLFRKITEQLLIGVLDRHYELQAHTIEERFKLFTERSPHLLGMVPHKYIASYLNIDPTNFSKLLGRIKI